MRSIPFVVLLVVAIGCSSFREKLQPTQPTPPETTRPVVSVTPDEEVDNTAGAPTDDSGKTVSGGILNDNATYLPQPAYPPAARAVRASGRVMVQVTVNGEGKVESATAVSGHPLLRAAATKAAQDATFEPKMLSGKRVKVTGAIVYDFAPAENSNR